VVSDLRQGQPQTETGASVRVPSLKLRSTERIEKTTENIGGKPVREWLQLQLLQSLRVFTRHS